MAEIPPHHSRQVDVSLYGDNLQMWNEWLGTQKQKEWLLSWGIQANKGAILISLPLWMLASVISIPLSLVSVLTAGLLFWPFHRLLIRPLVFIVLSSSRLWAALPVVRPLLLLLGPLFTITATVVTSLIPDGNVDIRDARRMLCELWPLSARRLEWIAERGTGRVEAMAG